MDRIFSARLDESAVSQIELLSQRLKTTKKDVIERAIRAFAELQSKAAEVDVVSATSGAWKRGEPAAKTAARAKKAFRDSMERHRR